MIYLGIALAVLLPVLALGALSAVAQRKSPPGVVDGSLSACPDSPNCVCSGDESARHQVEPIGYQGDPSRAMDQMNQVLRELPRSTEVTRTDGYLHYVVRSALFRFPDDVEIRQDRENRRFQIRSASRAGKSDLGVNRQRVERIREQFQQLNGEE